jgi:hypothetical protein
MESSSFYKLITTAQQCSQQRHKAQRRQRYKARNRHGLKPGKCRHARFLPVNIRKGLAQA